MYRTTSWDYSLCLDCVGPHVVEEAFRLMAMLAALRLILATQ